MTTEISPALSSANHPAVFRRGVVWLLALTLSMAALLLPALWNGFALVFFDTGGYVRRVLEMELTPGRSLFYGLFLWTSSFAWWSFYGPILVQVAATVWFIYLLLRCHDLSHGPWLTALFCSILALVTGVAWSAAQLMPDALVPLIAVALWLLGFCRQKLTGMERFGVAALALLGLLSHMSGLALAIGLLLVIVLLWLAEHRRVSCWLETPRA